MGAEHFAQILINNLVVSDSIVRKRQETNTDFLPWCVDRLQILEVVIKNVVITNCKAVVHD